jgi:phospholipid/cholesterol/gamma-HCH transport system permease protein
MSAAALCADRQGHCARLIPSGQFDLAHVTTIAKEIASLDAQAAFDGCSSVELELGGIERVDGTGAVLLARLLDRLEAAGPETHVAGCGERIAVVYPTPRALFHKN